MTRITKAAQQKLDVLNAKYVGHVMKKAVLDIKPGPKEPKIRYRKIEKICLAGNQVIAYVKDKDFPNDKILTLVDVDSMHGHNKLEQAVDKLGELIAWYATRGVSETAYYCYEDQSYGHVEYIETPEILDGNEDEMKAEVMKKFKKIAAKRVAALKEALKRYEM